MLAHYLTVLAKLYLDRRPYRGASEFRFRIRPSRDHRYITVRAREGDFRARIALRPHTSDLGAFEQTFANNDYNLRRFSRWREICATYDQLLASGTPVILDLGANIGMASLYFAKNWPQAAVLAVEPSEANVAVMKVNVDGFPNITPMLAAVASERVPVIISNPTAEAWAFRTEIASAARPGAVQALPVDALLESVPNARPFIAKIDIEGFEKELFSQHTQWISRFPIIIIELHDWILPRAGTSQPFLRAIAAYDRDFVSSGENIISIANRPAVIG